MLIVTYQIIGGILIFVSSLVGENMSPNKKKGWYFTFAFLAVVYVGAGIFLDRHASTQQSNLYQTISDLQASFEKSESARKSEREAAEKARQSDRDAFLSQLGSLSNQVSVVRANVQTDSLRKQLDHTQLSLRQTHRALEKHEVKLDFVVNGQVNPTEVNAQRSHIGDSTIDQFVLSGTLVNNSNEDAASGHAEISIVCSDCKGIRFVGVDPWPYWGTNNSEVAKDFFGVVKHSSLALGRVALITDAGTFPRQVRIALRYRCLFCVPEEWDFVVVNLVG